MRWIAVICLGMGAVIVGMTAWHIVNQPTETPPASTAKTDSDEPARRIFASGTLEGARREIALQFEITGRLKAVTVRAGETVAQGTVLAELETDLLDLKRDEAIAQLELAKAERDRLIAGATPDARKAARTAAKAAELQLYEEAELFNQAKTAYQKDELPKETFEQARLKYARVNAEFNALRQQADSLEAVVGQNEIHVADSKVALAEAGVRQAEAMLKKAKLVAPEDGSVLLVQSEVGEIVGPQSDRCLLKFADLSKTRVRAYVEELDASSVAVGQSAKVVADRRTNQTFEGRIVSCAPYVGPKQHQHLKPGERFDLRVREIIVEVTSGSDLLIGLPVEVFIEPTSSRARTGTAESLTNRSTP